MCNYCVKLYTFFYLAFMSEKKNLKTHINFDVFGLWLKVKKNAHCENIHTAYAVVIYQTGPKILAHFTIQSNVAWKTVFLESGYVCLIVCLLHGQENAFMPCYIAHLSEFTCWVSGPFFYSQPLPICTIQQLWERACYNSCSETPEVVRSKQEFIREG